MCELAPAARGSQDAGSRNLVFTSQLSTVQLKLILGELKMAKIFYQSETLKMQHGRVSPRAVAVDNAIQRAALIFRRQNSVSKKGRRIEWGG